ncbi:MAG: hypothetical protein J7K00_01810 [Candidatus Diapherotrites archaeon]|nr:hypothetical protein [Candidatus Diapherotrites archaeon]
MAKKKKHSKDENKKVLDDTGSDGKAAQEKSAKHGEDKPGQVVGKEDSLLSSRSKTVMDKEEDFLFKVLVAAFLVVLVFLVYSVATQKPVYYSQLYFNEQSLPGEVDANSSFSFSFVIENHEKEAFQYLYMLTINNETSDQFTYMVPSEVEQGDRIEQNIKMALGPSDEPVKVGIKVPTPSSDEPLEIHFWVDVVDEASEN